MNIRLTVSGSAANRQVLQCATVTTHWVTFKVVKAYHEVIICQVSSHDVVFQMCMVFHGNSNFVVFVHQVNSKQRVESMLISTKYFLISSTNLSTLFFGILPCSSSNFISSSFSC